MLLKTYNKIYDTDIGYSFFNSKLAVISSPIFFIILFCSVFAGIVAPYNPFDPASVSLMMPLPHQYGRMEEVLASF